MQCKVCGKLVRQVMLSVFVRSRNKVFKHLSKHKTCSVKCRRHAQGSSNRLPPAKCKVRGCAYFGNLDKKVCPKHYQYFWRHGIYTIPNPRIKPLRLTRYQATWLAAVIDCEGWVGVFRNTRQGKATGFWGAVGVGNTNPLLPERIKRWTGVGSINISDRGKKNKPLHMWTVARHEHVKALLLAVRKHLLLKRRQADLVLSMPPKHTRANKIRSRIKDQLTVLNRKGQH